MKTAYHSYQIVEYTIMQHHPVPANAEAMPFRQLENEICRAKNSVSILQRIVEDSGINLSREDISLINYAAENALNEVSDLHSKFYAALEGGHE